MAVPADILIVIATLVTGFSFASVVAGWTVRQWPVVSLISLAIGLGLFAFLHIQLADGLRWFDIPDAFIGVAARVLN